jgi:hypothetical protein
MVNRLGPNIHGEPLCAAKEEKQVSNMGTFPPNSQLPYCHMLEQTPHAPIEGAPPKRTTLWGLSEIQLSNALFQEVRLGQRRTGRPTCLHSSTSGNRDFNILFNDGRTTDALLLRRCYTEIQNSMTCVSLQCQAT